MPDDATTPYDHPVTVDAGDIDELGHVNNTVYLRWVQDAATAHWSVLASEEEKASLLWIVLRHEIDYKRPAVEGDEITARTWVGEASGLRFIRHTEIRRDGTVLARARTTWCPIDRETQRPRRVPASIRERFSDAE